jgi:hypothetical protein
MESVCDGGVEFPYLFRSRLVSIGISILPLGLPFEEAKPQFRAARSVLCDQPAHGVRACCCGAECAHVDSLAENLKINLQSSKMRYRDTTADKHTHALHKVYLPDTPKYTANKSSQRMFWLFFGVRRIAPFIWSLLLSILQFQGN